MLKDSGGAAQPARSQSVLSSLLDAKHVYGGTLASKDKIIDYLHIMTNIYTLMTNYLNIIANFVTT